MALNPETKYPTKMDPSSADYPYGTPRNISAPGAGDGTPWEMDVVKDIFALQQTLLSLAGITPSGDADTAPECQQLHAIGKVSGRAIDATTAILTTDLREAAWVSSEGYAAPDDGGGALWRATGNTVPGSAGTSAFTSGLIYDLHGTEFRYAPPVVNPRAFGAVGDGVTNDVAAIDAALRVASLATPAVGGIVYFPAGTYFCNSQITLYDRVVLRGAGLDVSIITFAGALGAFPGSACIVGTGTASALPDLSATMVRGVTTLSFASAHSLAVDDVVMICNPTNYSWGSYATHYRAGEMVRVSAVPSGTTITTTSPTWDTYTAAGVDNYLLVPKRVGFADLTIRGIGTSTTIAVIDVNHCRDVFLRDCALSGSQKALARFDRCYGVDVQRVSLVDRTTPLGLSHGVLVANCQRVTISNVRGAMGGAMIALAPADAIRGVPTREVSISDCQTGAGAFRGVLCEGDCEHVEVVGCTLARSTFGGDGTRWTGCTFLSDSAAALDCGNVRGYDHEFRSCTFGATQNLSGAGLAAIAPASMDADTDGVISFFGCTFDLRGYTGKLGYLVVTDTGTRPALVVQGGVVLGSGGSGDAFEIRSGVAAAYWDRVAVRGVELFDAILYLDGFASAGVHDCESHDSPGDGIWFNAAAGPPVAAPVIHCRGNVVRGSWLAGIRSAIAAAVIYMSGNVSLNNRQSGSSDANASISVSGAGTLVLSGNTIGDDQAVATQTRDLYVSTLTLLIDAGSIRLGNLSETMTGVGTERRFGSWAEVPDRIRASGWLALSDADANVHFSGARDLTIGDGAGDHGISIRSGTADISALRFGDSVSNIKAGVIYGHSTGILTLRSAGANTLNLTASEVYGSAASAVDVGTAAAPFRKLHTDRRYVSGTQIDAGDFSLSAGWGTTATLATAQGYDGGGWFEVNSSGTGQATNPYVNLTFADGAWENTPCAVIVREGSATGSGQWRVDRVSSTVIRFYFIGELPVAGTSYPACFFVFGIPA